MEKFFCRMPYEAFCVSSDGFSQPCCAIGGKPHPLVKKFDSMSDWYNTDLNKSIRNDLDQEIMPTPFCSETCGKRIAAGIKNNKEIYDTISSHYNFEPGVLKFLDIAFSNTCNLNCVMCSNKFSSKWNEITKTADEDFLNLTKQEREYTHSLTFEQIDDILENCKDLKIVVIKGGEPMYDKKTLYFLENLALINPNVSINMVSNLTLLNENLISKFPKLKITASIDGVDETYEWIRGTKFDIVYNNFKKLIEMDVKVGVNFVVQMYNFHCIQETHDRFLDLQKDKTFVNRWKTYVATNSYAHWSHLEQEKVDAVLSNLNLSTSLILDKRLDWGQAGKNQQIEFMQKFDKIRGFRWEDIPKKYK